MKSKLFYILCAVVGLLQSCTNEVDDIFDASAQQRMNEEIRVCKELLTSSELGWKLDYYPSSTQQYGGFALTLKFDNQKVTAGSEITTDPSVTASSYYSLKSDMGPTLNFDTYNEIIHYFSDPDYTFGGGQGKGYEGDFEFVIVSHNENEIILKGKKTKNIMKMTRLEESSQAYVASVQKNRENMMSIVGISGYDGQINGQKVSISLPSDRRANVQIGTEELIKTAYMYSPNGIKFYQPIEIGGKEVYGLDWSTDQKTFVSADGAMTPIEDIVYKSYTRYLGEYTMSYTYGNTPREIPIKVVFNQYNPSQKNYTIEGLPFPLILQYNADLDCMEFIVYTSGSCYFAVWKVTGKGSLEWRTPGIGMIAQLRKDTNNVYDFVDNGVWESYVARAIILWSAAGEYHGFGGDTRYQYITFTKK